MSFRGSITWVLALVTGAGCSAPAQVSLTRDGKRHRIERDGRPFQVKGAGGEASLKLLAEVGGNAIRTWGADRLGAVLDEAHRHGLGVAAGIWLGHERHGFRYTDPDQVAKQQEAALDVVRQYKDHPALLVWSLGNEMEGEGSNAAVWLAVNSLAAQVKKLDPKHPTMTVIAEVGGQKVRNLHRLCPDIDIVGINAYGGAASVADRYVAAGGTKPFMLTEFGPPGMWEMEKTAWGAPRELTSTEKANWYLRAWQSATASPLCLGGFAFAWGHKQEATATWFGMLLPDGARLGAVDAMSEAWTGKPPPNRCPVIASLKAEPSGEVEPGSSLRFDLMASDPEGDPLAVRWVLQAETARYGSGGDAEAAPPVIEGAVTKGTAQGATVKAPETPGPYRLYAYVADGKGGAATANVPFRVKGEVKVTPAPTASLPLVVYSEKGAANVPFTPSGWMGASAAVKMDEGSNERPSAGATCIRCEYTAPDAWAGVVWQHPDNDWGDLPGGYNLTGAGRLVFKARGAKGGEVVSFFLGIIKKDKPFHDTCEGRLDNVRLGTEWREYAIALDGKDLSRIKTGFGWTVAGQGAPITFYLDEIRYER